MKAIPTSVSPLPARLSGLVWVALSAVGVLLLASVTIARPYGVRLWNQHGDYLTYYDNTNTDLATPAGVQLTYSQLASEPTIRRALDANSNTLPIVFDSNHAWLSRDFLPNDYFRSAEDGDAIADGGWHCAPTSFGMADDYWWDHALPRMPTIMIFAGRIDTNDINAAFNAGDHVLHYGSYLRDMPAGVAAESPPNPWPGTYASQRLWDDPNVGPTPAERRLYYGEIRAGRPTTLTIPGHAMLGIDFSTSEALVNDPWDANANTATWANVRSFVSQQPHCLGEKATGGQIYFSNDSFGTGQANVQAPGGDPGDIFGVDRGTDYGLALDDVSAGWTTADADHPDYYDYTGGRTVTSGLEQPFDIDGMDVLASISRMRHLTYSADDGDPNPHDWIPGSQDGNASYQQRELTTIRFDTLWLTMGQNQADLHYIPSSDEDDLGLNRAEVSLPDNLLDDDIDAVESEFSFEQLYWTPDYVDTRVFPEYPATVNPSWQLSGQWHELAGLDPTDIYDSAGNPFIDGETVLALAEGCDLDALQFIWDPILLREGLLYSVDMLGDAPDCRDAYGADLQANTIYLSWLDGAAPIPYWTAPVVDLDAITWTPEPTTAALLAFFGLCGPSLRRRASFAGDQ